jgi:hypothetical protein
MVNDNEKRKEIEKKYTEHLNISKIARGVLKFDQNVVKTDKKQVTITFDIQRTLPTPRIQTSLAYYKRPLWVYNLGIHSYQSDDETSYIIMWHEAVASRRAQEVSSCLKYFTKNFLDSEINHLTASCGGQNRNIKV